MIEQNNYKSTNFFYSSTPVYSEHRDIFIRTMVTREADSAVFYRWGEGARYFVNDLFNFFNTYIIT